MEIERKTLSPEGIQEFSEANPNKETVLVAHPDNARFVNQYKPLVTVRLNSAIPVLDAEGEPAIYLVALPPPDEIPDLPMTTRPPEPPEWPKWPFLR